MAPSSATLATKQRDAGKLTALDCAFNRLIYNTSIALVASAAATAFDALRLAECNVVRAPSAGSPRADQAWSAPPLRVLSDGQRASVSSEEFPDLHAALAWRRAHRSDRSILLQRGTHYLGHSGVELGSADSGLHLLGESGAELSGGVPLRGLKWNRPTDGRGPSDANTWVASIGEALLPASASLPSLQTHTPHRRLTRARFPNGDLETDQWGYASPHQFDVALPGECRGCRPSAVENWITLPAGMPQPTFSYVDLTVAGNPTGATKDDSGMGEYNAYGTGKGGLCDKMWDTAYGGSGSYWCGNNTAGGWAEVDANIASKGELLLPVGLTYNASHPRVARIRHWVNASGAVVRAWHPQSWALHMFRVSSHDLPRNTLHFDKGGSQGGRLWCRCDQCSYVCAAERKGTPHLASGSWFIDGVRDELDAPGEWFFNETSRELYLWPNGTQGGSGGGQLQTLLKVTGGATGVTISGITFRDAAPVYLEKWGVPSGGDWALHRGGALHVENSTAITVVDCRFERLDGTAVFLGGRTRNVTVANSSFAWLGDNGVSLWGSSAEWNATGGNYPRGTLIEGNLFRELGIHEKQSSAVFIAKSAFTTITGNVVFNVPRAAINLNDGAMGGHVIEKNVLFHTCRESGDHGAINTWDRLPFLHTEGAGGVPSFATVPIQIRDNLISATYGASQAVDNDDGSSFYRTFRNVFYAADGFKMDYGGHDSSFHSNLVIVAPYDGQHCVNNLGVHNAFSNNTCALTGSRDPTDVDVVGGYPCGGSVAKTLSVTGNTYHTPHGNASLTCGGDPTALAEVQRRYGLEEGSTAGRMPADAALLATAVRMVATWAPRVLQPSNTAADPPPSGIAADDEHHDRGANDDDFAPCNGTDKQRALSTTIATATTESVLPGL